MAEVVMMLKSINATNRMIPDDDKYRVTGKGGRVLFVSVRMNLTLNIHIKIKVYYL